MGRRLLWGLRGAFLGKRSEDSFDGFFLKCLTNREFACKKQFDVEIRVVLCLIDGHVGNTNYDYQITCQLVRLNPTI